MLDVEVIEDPVAARAALDPTRSRVLASLAQPASAAGLASRLKLPRQKDLYGPRSDAAAKRDEPIWQAWISKHFPATGGGAGPCGP